MDFPNFLLHFFKVATRIWKSTPVTRISVGLNGSGFPSTLSSWFLGPFLLWQPFSVSWLLSAQRVNVASSVL